MVTGRKAILRGTTALAVACAWTASSSTIFVMLSGLSYHFTPGTPSRYWAWWSYLLWGTDLYRVPMLLGLSAVVPTLLLAVVAYRIYDLRRPRQQLYGETRAASPSEMTASGLWLKGKGR
jgi:hypothetical protein